MQHLRLLLARPGGAITAAPGESDVHAPSRAAKQAGTATPTGSVRYPTVRG